MLGNDDLKSAMDIQKIKNWTTKWENRKEKVYTDSSVHQHPTIGIGFNLDRPDAKKKIQALGVNYSQVRSGSQTLDQKQIDQLFHDDINKAINGARRQISNFDSLPENKQMVIVDMVFNLGEPRFSKFKKTIQAIEKQDWQQTAEGMKSSQWFHQVGSRDDQRGGMNVAIIEGSTQSKPSSLQPPPSPKISDQIEPFLLLTVFVLVTAGVKTVSSILTSKKLHKYFKL